VNVYAKDANDPAVRVEFQQITFATPDAEQFTFNPPPGTKVKSEKPADVEKARAKGEKAAEKAAREAAESPEASAMRPTVVGSGWASIVVTKVPDLTADNSDAKGAKGAEVAGQVAAVLNGLPKVSGSWGSGRLLQGALFSALLTDDGRLLAGAVAPEKLYEVAATKAGK
jgi:hypothetical protein